MQKKKIILGLIIATSILCLGSCGSSKSKKSNASNESVESVVNSNESTSSLIDSEESKETTSKSSETSLESSSESVEDTCNVTYDILGNKTKISCKKGLKLSEALPNLDIVDGSNDLVNKSYEFVNWKDLDDNDLNDSDIINDDIEVKANLELKSIELNQKTISEKDVTEYIDDLFLYIEKSFVDTTDSIKSFYACGSVNGSSICDGYYRSNDDKFVPFGDNDYFDEDVRIKKKLISSVDYDTITGYNKLNIYYSCIDGITISVEHTDFKYQATYNTDGIMIRDDFKGLIDGNINPDYTYDFMYVYNTRKEITYDELKTLVTPSFYSDVNKLNVSIDYYNEYGRYEWNSTSNKFSHVSGCNFDELNLNWYLNDETSLYKFLDYTSDFDLTLVNDNTVECKLNGIVKYVFDLETGFMKEAFVDDHTLFFDYSLNDEDDSNRDNISDLILALFNRSDNKTFDITSKIGDRAGSYFMYKCGDMDMCSTTFTEVDSNEILYASNKDLIKYIIDNASFDLFYSKSKTKYELFFENKNDTKKYDLFFDLNGRLIELSIYEDTTQIKSYDVCQSECEYSYFEVVSNKGNGYHTYLPYGSEIVLKNNNYIDPSTNYLYEFEGYYFYSDQTIPFDEKYVSDSSVIVYAKYKEDKSETYTIKAFNNGNATDFISGIVLKDSIISLNSIVTGSGKKLVDFILYKPGYYFDGWYTSNTYEEEFNFNNPITEDTNIYAKYLPNTLRNFVIAGDVDGTISTFESINSSSTFTETNIPCIRIKGDIRVTTKPTMSTTFSSGSILQFDLGAGCLLGYEVSYENASYKPLLFKFEGRIDSATFNNSGKTFATYDSATNTFTKANSYVMYQIYYSYIDASINNGEYRFDVTEYGTYYLYNPGKATFVTLRTKY